MATYLELHELVTNEDFGKRIQVGMWKASAGVFAEGTSVENHDIRRALARKVIMGGVQTPPRIIAVGIVQVPTIFAAGAAATDAQIQTAVDNLFTIFAQMEARYGA
jgi:hypothetical protein